MYYANVNLFLYFIHFNNVISKQWNIWCIAKGGWVCFYCFLINSFQITFKYLQNLVIVCFQFVKFLWKNYHMLKADKDGRMRMFCLHKEFLLYISSNANGIEKSDICWQKFPTSFNSITRRTCCNVKLNIMMKRWKYRMANVLNCREIFFTNLEAVESRSRSLKLQSIDELFELRPFEKVKRSNIVKGVPKKYFSYLTDKIASLRKNVSKTLVIQFWFLLLFLVFFY